MSLQSKDTRSVVNLGERPVKVTACAAHFEFEAFEVKVLPSQTHANVAVSVSRAAKGTLDYFDPEKHFARVKEYRQKQLVGRVELLPDVTSKTDPDTLATMLTIDKRTMKKPSRESLKKAPTTTLASYLIAFRQPAINVETGKELSKQAMLEKLYELLGYPLVDPEVVRPAPSTPRSYIEVQGEPDVDNAPEKQDGDDADDEE